MGVVGRSSFIRDNLQWDRDVTRTRVETRRGLDEGRSVEAKGGRLQSKIREKQGSKVVEGGVGRCILGKRRIWRALARR